MVLQIGMNLKISLIVYMAVVAANCLVVLIGKPWIKRAGFVSLIIYLVLSPLTVFVSAFEVWKHEVLLNADAQDKVNNFINACKAHHIMFEDKWNAMQTGLFVMGFLGLEPNESNIQPIIEGLEEEKILELNEDGVYVFNMANATSITANENEDENE